MKLNILFVFLSVFISLNSYAFKFSPMSTSIETKSGNNSTLFYLENDSDQPIAVTVSVLTREMNAEGVETNNKIDGEMTVYPSQLIIPGNEKVKAIAGQLQEKGFDVKAILSPTVPEGQERLRFCLHSYNSTQEISAVMHCIYSLL